MNPIDSKNTKTDSFLLTTNLDLELPIKVKKVILGDWVIGVVTEHEKLNIQTFHWEDSLKKNKDYNYIISLYEKILKELKTRLNKKFGINKSERYWRIILGPWLTYYLVVNFDRWEILRKCFEKENKYAVAEFEQGKDILNCADTLEFIKKSEQSNFFNHALFLRIIKFQYSEKTKIINVNEKYFDEKDEYFKKTFKSIKSNGNKNIIFNFISNLALRYNKIIFDDFNYPKKNFINLNSKSLSVPIKLGKFFSNYNFKKFNKDSNREEIFKNIIEEKTPFEKYINEFLGKDLPLSLFESISVISEEIQKFVKKRLILSMYSFMHYDFFKIWLAESVEMGSRLVISEHGGGLDALLDLDRKHYVDIADRFAKFTSTSFSKKDIKMSPIMPVVNEDFRNSQGKNCTIIDLDTAKYTVKIVNNAYASEKRKILQDQIIFTQGLKKEIFEKVKYRIAGNHMGFSKIIEKKFGSSKISLDKVRDADSSSSVFFKNLNNSIFNDFRKSKVIVCAYPLTPFFEAMVSGIPTILFCRYKYWEMKKESREMYDLLKKSEIAFEDPLLASSHINNFWNNINEWWLDEKTIKTRKFFLENFYNVKKDWKNDWSKFISEEYKQVFPSRIN